MFSVSLFSVHLALKWTTDTFPMYKLRDRKKQGTHLADFLFSLSSPQLPLLQDDFFRDRERARKSERMQRKEGRKEGRRKDTIALSSTVLGVRLRTA